jgi:hypothetical protein
MKLGIEKLEFIPAANCRNWNFVPRNGSIAIASFITAAFSTIDFTSLMCSFEEEWIDDAQGKYSQINITGTIRTSKKAAAKLTMQKLLIGKYIYRVKAASGEKFIIGSLDYLPKFAFKNMIEELTTSEYQFVITLKSPHGSITDTSV